MSEHPDPIKLGIMGIDHGHIFGMLQNMLAIGCTCTHWWSGERAVTQDKFEQVFPSLNQVEDYRAILDDPDVKMVLISSIPSDRADLAIAAMEAGKDVMVDKPGCTTLEQLARIREVQARTGRIWSVNFSERFEVASVTKAEELVFGGAIGTVK
ncbi:MAG: Gfo/Idh/MocA family oxidoreductase, partial [Pseudomonadota bacterium]